MSQPEADDVFRARVLTAVADEDRVAAMMASGPALDAIGRRYGRFRTGVALAFDEDAERRATADLGNTLHAMVMRPLSAPAPEYVERLRRDMLRGCQDDPDILAAEADPADPTAILVTRKPVEPLFYVEIDVPAWQPPPQTVMGVRYPQSRVEDCLVRAFLVISRMGLDHTLAYLFLGGDPALERVEALVRDQPLTFPGDVVVVDLGESYPSLAAAEARAAEMRSNMPRAVTFIVADLDG